MLMPPVWQALALGGDHRVDLRLVENEPDDATQALRQHRVDIAVVHAYSLLPRDLPPGCEQHRLLDEPVYLAIHPRRASRHGLEAGHNADLSHFAADDWVMPGPESACHEMTQRACGSAGFVPNSVALATDFSVLAALVAVDAGAALIPKMALPADTSELSLHPLAEPVTRSISALTATGADRQPQVRMVLDHLSRIGGSR